MSTIKTHDPSSILTDFGPTAAPLLLISHLSRSAREKGALKELWLDVVSEEQNLAAVLSTKTLGEYSETLRLGRSARSNDLLKAVRCADVGNWAGADEILRGLFQSTQQQPPRSLRRSPGLTPISLSGAAVIPALDLVAQQEILLRSPGLKARPMDAASPGVPPPFQLDAHSTARKAASVEQEKKEGTTLESVRGALGIAHLSPAQLIKHLEWQAPVSFPHSTDDDNNFVKCVRILDVRQFTTRLVELVDSDVYARLTVDLRREHFKLMAHIFDALYVTQIHKCTDEMKESGSLEHVTTQDLGIALSIFCGGTAAERTAAAFDLLDQAKDGYIRESEMAHYLLIMFTCIFALTGNDTPYVVEDLVQMMTKSCFEEADINHDGRISWEEFVNWYSESGLS